MPEQENEYHPAVEEVMETSGPDTGRIKDLEAARRAAEDMNERRDRGLEEDQVASEVEDNIRYGVEGKAFRQVRTKGAEGKTHGSMEPDSSIKKRARSEADKAGKSYDQLQKDAEVARARAKIDDAGEAA